MSDSHSTIGAPEVSAGSEADAARGVGTPGAGAQPVTVTNPLKTPYRTGSYLIYDEGTTLNFRSATGLKTPPNWPAQPGLAEQPYRASGSHQLDLKTFEDVLAVVKGAKPTPTQIYLVDLREETHGFLDCDNGPRPGKGVAVSWYADNDFANVGQTKDWITTDEAARLGALAHRTPSRAHPITQVFQFVPDAPDNRCQDRVEPASYTETGVAAAYNEAQVAKTLSGYLGAAVTYARIPVTDHCAPGDDALNALRSLRQDARQDPASWVHFHCHGGDGRTTTFLALYDMLCWDQKRTPLPSLQDFACRQRQLFGYCLNPRGCVCSGRTYPASLEAPWKVSLAEARWERLETFRQSLIRP